MHKGNDLLIEVFSKHKDWNLFLCGREIAEECKSLGYKLPDNIHNCGFIDVTSDDFCELASKCLFTILPSCSEGMSTSLLTCMCHGMIPVTMRGTGMDELAEYCLFFAGYKIEQIESKIEELLQLPAHDLVSRSSKIYNYSNERFSISSYTEEIRKILSHILNS